MEQEDYEIITAYNGSTGIEKALSQFPDLILLNVMMPDITGIEVCRRLVNDPTTKNIPIILVTAKSGAVDTKEEFEAGVFDYIKNHSTELNCLQELSQYKIIRST
ncbi:MAG: response regulator [Ignavibacterium sp.]|uniref:response regulator n=1 Tax=Ignavibacterium sp. TaxID=2651167 RepID=UPI00404A6CDD